MRAIGYRKASPELDHLEAFDIPRPKPEGRDLLVEVRAVSVNPVDYKVASGGGPGSASRDGRNQGGRLRRRRGGRGNRPRGAAFQAGRRSVLRRQRRTPGRGHGVSSRRRTDRGPQAAHARFRRRRGFALDLDHRLGGDVRPARCRETRSRRGARDPDPRRRRRRRFDRHPARAAIDRSCDHRDRLAARDRAMGEGHGRASCHRPQEAADAADRGARPGQSRLSSSRPRRWAVSSPTSPN